MRGDRSRRWSGIGSASAEIDRHAKPDIPEIGVPKVLKTGDRRALAEWLGCDPEELRHDFVPPCRSPKRRTPRFTPPNLPGAPLAAVAEMAVSASAGPGALAEDNAAETARWYLPEAMLRHEGRTAPENLRILGARGDSMEPLIGEGDRIVVDLSCRTPVTGEMVVLWDGGGLVVKRVEMLPRSEPPALRLISANPAYEPYTCLADEAHIVGKIVCCHQRVCIIRIHPWGSAAEQCRSGVRQ